MVTSGVSAPLPVTLQFPRGACSTTTEGLPEPEPCMHLTSIEVMEGSAAVNSTRKNAGAASTGGAAGAGAGVAATGAGVAAAGAGAAATGAGVEAGGAVGAIRTGPSSVVVGSGARVDGRDDVLGVDVGGWGVGAATGAG